MVGVPRDARGVGDHLRMRGRRRPRPQLRRPAGRRPCRRPRPAAPARRRGARGRPQVAADAGEGRGRQAEVATAQAEPPPRPGDRPAEPAAAPPPPDRGSATAEMLAMATKEQPAPPAGRRAATRPAAPRPPAAGPAGMAAGMGRPARRPAAAWRPDAGGGMSGMPGGCSMQQQMQAARCRTSMQNGMQDHGWPDAGRAAGRARRPGNGRSGRPAGGSGRQAARFPHARRRRPGVPRRPEGRDLDRLTEATALRAQTESCRKKSGDVREDLRTARSRNRSSTTWRRGSRATGSCGENPAKSTGQARRDPARRRSDRTDNGSGGGPTTSHHRPPREEGLGRLRHQPADRVQEPVDVQSRTRQEAA